MERIQRKAIEQELFEKASRKRDALAEPKPLSYRRPPYNTPQYWRDCLRGWITDEEQLQDHNEFHTRRRRALDSKSNRAAAPSRHERAAPRESKQFSRSMSTQAARDDRLTPQSKALLQVLVARMGRGRSTDTTKTTLGVIMNRCPRSIQRYLQELTRFGYIRAQIRKSRRTGFFIGLRIWIMDCVLPFFAEKSPDFDSEKWLSLPNSRRNSEETEESLTKVKDTIQSVFSAKKPPWIADYVY